MSARALLLLGLLGASAGCTKVADVEGPGPSSQAQAQAVDLSADRAAVQASWLLELAKDSSALITLAEANPGWAPYFKGSFLEAIEAFERAAQSGDLDAQIGLARACLEQAAALRAVGDTQRALLPDWLKAQRTRPDAAQLAPWYTYLEARNLRGERADLEKILAGVPEEAWGEAAPLLKALSAGAGPLYVALSASGQAGEGAEVEAWPGPITQAMRQRLEVLQLVRAGKAKAAVRLFRRIDPLQGDLEIQAASGKVSFHDPHLADLGALVWASYAQETTQSLEGWPALLHARALMALGQPEAAADRLEKLWAGGADLPAPPLALLILSESLGPADLRAQVRALQVQAATQRGQAQEAQKLLADLGEDTITHRVWRGWAQAVAGQKPSLAAFPEDRDVFTRVFTEAIVALGDAAKGQEDVTALLLVERTVDAAQRRFAELARFAQDGALAVKHREAAEDKIAAQAPSTRNTLAALAEAADDNVAIGRPRVALKYYSRMRERLPAVAVPSEMLRDLLSLQAMEHDGSATAGQ